MGMSILLGHGRGFEFGCGLLEVCVGCRVEVVNRAMVAGLNVSGRRYLFS